ncbi:hypothetical protein [Desulfosporosinus nitroreducens]|uniref:Uncharacterized protein n=1 Tax=Desulfosporosinus nitroreducens TaxID=2018668 RepID=A0ABT8QPN3_9FIRM|nr:hypothetical protein [Desulfosporosinus nitroreducens]MDO0823317.1 hypothetical protein [Desulfosporosinus nitroreducens]
MAKGDTDIIGLFAKALIGIFHGINKLTIGKGDQHVDVIDTIFKRNGICVKSPEKSDSSNEYPKLLKQERDVLYYKMPVGMSYKQIEKIDDVFESSLKEQVNVKELKDHPDAHFSITITEKTA